MRLRNIAYAVFILAGMLAAAARKDVVVVILIAVLGVVGLLVMAFAGRNRNLTPRDVQKHWDYSEGNPDDDDQEGR